MALNLREAMAPWLPISAYEVDKQKLQKQDDISGNGDHKGQILHSWNEHEQVAKRYIYGHSKGHSLLVNMHGNLFLLHVTVIPI